MLRSNKVRKCSGKIDSSPEAAAKDATIARKLQQQMKPLSGEQFILAYSPLIELQEMKNQSILVVGATGAERVARSYGFNNVIHANEYARRHPEQSPWFTNWVAETPPGCAGLRGDEANIHGEGPFEFEDIDTIFVMSDPNYFGQALELCVDFLLSTNPFKREIDQQQPKIIFANPDLLWRAEFPRNRLGLGAFKIALRAVYHERLLALGLSKEEISQREENRWVQLGKPMPLQYHFAERKLDQLLHILRNEKGAAREINTSCIDQFYMIGDNHDTDIAGATATGKLALLDSKNRRNWESVLVKTGVWKPGFNTQGATVVKENALLGLDWIIKDSLLKKIKKKNLKSTNTSNEL
jgi:HAD superfamily hydrolase (TIGR01456 family)